MGRLYDRAMDILEDVIWGKDMNEIPDRLREHVKEMDRNIISLFVWSVLIPLLALIILAILSILGWRRA